MKILSVKKGIDKPSSSNKYARIRNLHAEYISKHQGKSLLLQVYSLRISVKH
jgi:hypothetical protein